VCIIIASENFEYISQVIELNVGGGGQRDRSVTHSPTRYLELRGLQLIHGDRAAYDQKSDNDELFGARCTRIEPFLCSYGYASKIEKFDVKESLPRPSTESPVAGMATVISYPEI